MKPAVYLCAASLSAILRRIVDESGPGAVLALNAVGRGDRTRGLSAKVKTPLLGRDAVWLREQSQLGFSQIAQVPESEIEEVRQIIEGQIGGQVASTSCTAIDFLKGLGGEASPLKSLWSRALRACLVGGRQELFYQRRTMERALKIDQTGSYVSIAAREPMPMGRGFETTRFSEEGVLEGKFDYFCLADVAVAGDPEGQGVGPLPYRAASGRLCCPRGRWTGGYWLSELLHEGVQILRLQKIWSYDLSGELRPVASRVLELRRASDHPIVRRFWKQVGVRLVGMLGMTEGPPSCFVLGDEDELRDTDEILSDDPAFFVVRRPGNPVPRDFTRLPAYSRILSLCRQETRDQMDALGRLGVEPLAIHTDGILVDGQHFAASILGPNWRVDGNWEAPRLDFWGSGAGTWELRDPARRVMVAEARSGYVEGDDGKQRVRGLASGEGLKGGRLQGDAGEDFLIRLGVRRTRQPAVDALIGDAVAWIQALGADP